jgi:sugar phosphate isomerase/epimerase
MWNRREFLQRTGALATGSLLLSKSGFSAFFGQQPHAIGIQLFTFFPDFDKDVPGTLKKIAAIGYKEVESAFSMLGGFYGHTPKEFASIVTDTGMTWKSHHVLGGPIKLPPPDKMPKGPDGKPMNIDLKSVKTLKNNMQEVVDDVAAAGVPYLVCASIALDTPDNIKESLEILNKTGGACKKAGITFCYHNHDQEFVAVGGEKPYDVLLSQIAPDRMSFEIDLCWATKAGVDPVDLFNKHPGRFPLWHVKDLDKDRQGPAPVGEGVVDFKRIFASAGTAGMQHFFVEHDMPKDPIASITESYNYLTKTIKY